MTGKAQLPRTSVDEIVKANKERKKQFGRERSLFAGIPQLLAVNGIGVSHKVSGGLITPIQGLPTAGGPMMGPIAFHPTTTGIVSGVLDIAKTTSAFSSRVIALGQASPDNLCRITGAAHAGQILFLQAVATYPIILKHLTDESPAVGNIYMPSGNDYTVAGKEIVLLQWDTINPPAGTEYGQWTLVATSQGSGGGSGFPNPADADLNMYTWDVINICATKFDNADGTELNSTDYGMEVYGNDLRYNIYGGVSTNDNSHAFRVENSTKFEIYEEYLLSWNDIRINSTKIIKSNSTSVGIGIYVSDASVLGVPSTKGTMGTLEGPYDSSEDYPATQGALDTLFGNSPGSIGVYEDTNGTSSYKGRLYYRSTDGWHIITGTKV